MMGLWRIFAALLRWGLGGCALLLVLAAFYVSLGRQVLPLVEQYRGEAQQRVSQMLAMPVSIGALEGHWSGFSPLLTVRDLRLGEGEQALFLRQVRVVPDLLASLKHWQLRIAELQFDGLSLKLLQDQQGHWQIDGLPPRADQPPLDIAKLLRQSQQIGRVSLFDSQLSIQPWQHESLRLSAIEFSLENGLSQQRMDLHLRLPDGQPLAMQLRSRMQPEHWQDSRAEVYLSLPQSDWASWLPAGLLQDWQLARLQLGGELWGLWDQQRLQTGVARLHVPEASGSYAGREPVILQDLALNAYFARSAEGFQLLLDDLEFTHGQQRWGQASLRLRQLQVEAQATAWQLSADHIDVAPLLPLVENLAPLPDKLRDLLQQLQPHGTVHNLQADWRPALSGPERLQFSANLERVGFAAWNASPAVENLSGNIKADLGQGELRIDSQDFSLHLTTLFPKAWAYQQAKGRLSWTLDETSFTLRAPYLQVQGEEGRVAGDFLIRLFRDPQQESYMDLRVGLRNGDARFTEKYLPSLVLQHDLDQWLKTAVRGGQVNEGYFQYQGAINHNPDPSVRSISLFFAVEDAELAYQPGWPALREASGEVLVEDSGVRVRLDRGSVLQSTVTDAQANVALGKTVQVPQLKLQAKLASSVADALKILQEAPTGVSAEFAGWQGSGALDGALSLDLPLKKAAGQRVVVDFRADQASLTLGKPALALSDISGDFRYDTDKGLSALKITAQALGHSLTGKAIADGRKGRARSQILADGVVPLNELSAWLGVQQPLPLRGRLPYSLRLSIDGKQSQLRAQSSLKGLSIDLPAPFGKSAQEQRMTRWRMSFGGSEQSYWLDYTDLASFAFAAPAGKWEQGRGELRLADGPAILPARRGIQVRGRVAQLDLSQWRKFANSYRGSASGNEQKMLSDAQLRIGHFQGFGLTVEDLELELRPLREGWSLELDSKLAKGKVDLSNRLGQPIVADLEYVQLPDFQTDPAQNPEAQAVDPLANVDPRQIPALNLRIAHVFQGGDDIGAWALKARPNAQGVLFSDLDINLKGLNMGGSLGWQGAPGKTSSWYKGRLQGKQLADVLTAWGYVASASSERFHLDADGRWPGSPAWFSLKRYSGGLDASLHKGQFNEVQGSAQALRVFGLLNFNSISRRLRLDFSDLLDKGLAYDRVKAKLDVTDGIFVTRQPINLTGPSSNLELNGTLNMVNQEINAKLLVTLPVTNNLPIAALIVGAPAIGGALFVVDKLLGDRVARFASVQYDVKGTLHDPQISFDKPFEKPAD